MKGLTLVLVALLGGAAGGLIAQDKKETVPEILKTARRGGNPIERVQAIDKLGALSDAGLVRDNGVVDALIGIAKPKDAKSGGDIFVRIAAIGALKRLQNIESRAKDKYIVPLSAILKDKAEHMLVAREVALNFSETLDPNGLQDKEASKTVSAIALDKQAKQALRIACIAALGNFGQPEGLDTLAGLLNEDQLIKEAAAGALYELLNRLDGTTELKVPTVAKLVEMVNDDKLQPDLRVNVMKVVATLMRDGSASAKQALPKLIEIVKSAQDDKLVIGAIHALGIIGTADSVEPLATAYLDYKPAANTEAGKLGGKEQDVRNAVVTALVTVLSNQGGKPSPDTKAVTTAATLLVKALDEDPSPAVKRNALFAMKYMYPFTTKTKDACRMVKDAALEHLNKQGQSDDIKHAIVEVLTAITGKDFGLDGKRWEEDARNNP
jgi:HEAT repeat protein